ncbi:MAG: TIGR00730 family Rossman fold protein [Clostridia bacterium]|nr:TIGR00730 family Rossman fold protein [Clostridia bacterium]
MRICVFGAASNRIDKKYIDDCYALGKLLASRGHDLIFGAGGEGLMGAIARGFKDGGAHVTGVIPKFFEEKGYEGMFYSADEIIRTETMADRKTIMEDGADAFIVVPGGIGTFDEFMQVLTLKQLGQHKKAIAVYNLSGFYEGLNAIFDRVIKKKFVNEECRGLFKMFKDKKSLIEYVESYDPDNINWELLKKG